MTSEQLTGKQKSHLRGLAHSLDPVVQVGKDGLTKDVTAAIERALLDHELIKVKVLESSPLDRHECAVAIVEALPRTALAGEIGRIVILYRRHPEKPVIKLPKQPASE